MYLHISAQRRGDIPVDAPSAAKALLLVVAFMVFGAFGVSAQLAFSGSDKKVLSEKMDAGTGLAALYIVYDTQGVTATYTASSDKPVRWYRFSNLGGGYAEDVASTVDGKKSSVVLTATDMGYIVEEGTDRKCFWVVNYANHHCRLESLSIADEQECDRARLYFEGSADKITYYTINGAARELSRDLVVDYNTLKFDEASESYLQVPASQTFASIDHSIGVFAPLCDTYFTLSGDRFLKQWGLGQTIESPNYRAIAIEAQTFAEQELREVENEQKVEASGLGGSAPVTVSFRAVVTDAAIFREWQMSKDPEFETVDDRFQQLDFEYTFRTNGNTFVRFVANNAAGTCEWVSESYEVFVGESGLLCPNVFSPNGDGVNDEWRVSYRSIVKYECHIFNRWGQEMMSSTDPAQGWDGRYKGKYVPTGVYYYVVKAVGADGKKYNLNGDINIIKGKRESATSAED